MSIRRPRARRGWTADDEVRSLDTNTLGCMAVAMTGLVAAVTFAIRSEFGAYRWAFVIAAAILVAAIVSSCMTLAKRPSTSAGQQSMESVAEEKARQFMWTLLFIVEAVYLAAMYCVVVASAQIT